jgi:DNA helicase II / ATP-dependent DNA helicase PcrA
VGTLDSFMLRFVVRPFGHVVGASTEGIQLIASPLDLEMRGHEVQIGATPKDKISLFRVRFNQALGANLTFRYTNHMGRNDSVPAAYSAAILARKKLLWKNTGLITHSDTHYLAATILETHPEIASLIAQRFPALLVDELQDTAWFLGRALIELLKVQGVRSMVVGDPDQAIYEFGGANPHLFSVIEALPGAKVFPLTVSQRCSRRVCNVASALSDSGAIVKARLDAPDGRAVMLVHGLAKPAPDATLIKDIVALTQEPACTTVLARRNQTILRLRGTEDRATFPGHSRLARGIDNACVLLRTGQASKASSIVSKELYALAFGDEVFGRTKLRARGIDIVEWKQSVYEILSSATESTATAWNDWISELRITIESELARFTGKTLALGAVLKKDSADALRSVGIATVSTGKWPQSFSFMNVHQAKGREFPSVVYFQPKPHAQHDPCPSSQWFVSGSEERRIAYVAATRAQTLFILCVHKDTYDALKTEQPNFVDLFQVFLLGQPGGSSVPA